MTIKDVENVMSGPVTELTRKIGEIGPKQLPQTEIKPRKTLFPERPSYQKFRERGEAVTPEDTRNRRVLQLHQELFQAEKAKLGRGMTLDEELDIYTKTRREAEKLPTDKQVAMRSLYERVESGYGTGMLELSAEGVDKLLPEVDIAFPGSRFITKPIIKEQTQKLVDATSKLHADNIDEYKQWRESLPPSQQRIADNSRLFFDMAEWMFIFSKAKKAESIATFNRMNEAKKVGDMPTYYKETKKLANLGGENGFLAEAVQEFKSVEHVPDIISAVSQTKASGGDFGDFVENLAVNRAFGAGALVAFAGLKTVAPAVKAEFKGLMNEIAEAGATKQFLEFTKGLRGSTYDNITKVQEWWKQEGNELRRFWEDESGELTPGGKKHSPAKNKTIQDNINVSKDMEAGIKPGGAKPTIDIAMDLSPSELAQSNKLAQEIASVRVDPETTQSAIGSNILLGRAGKVTKEERGKISSISQRAKLTHKRIRDFISRKSVAEQEADIQANVKNDILMAEHAERLKRDRQVATIDTYIEHIDEAIDVGNTAGKTVEQTKLVYDPADQRVYSALSEYKSAGETLSMADKRKIVTQSNDLAVLEDRLRGLNKQLEKARGSERAAIKSQIEVAVKETLEAKKKLDGMRYDADFYKELEKVAKKKEPGWVGKQIGKTETTSSLVGRLGLEEWWAKEVWVGRSYAHKKSKSLKETYRKTIRKHSKKDNQTAWQALLSERGYVDQTDTRYINVSDLSKKELAALDNMRAYVNRRHRLFSNIQNGVKPNDGNKVLINKKYDSFFEGMLSPTNADPKYREMITKLLKRVQDTRFKEIVGEEPQNRLSAALIDELEAGKMWAGQVVLQPIIAGKLSGAKTAVKQTLNIIDLWGLVGPDAMIQGLDPKQVKFNRKLRDIILATEDPVLSQRTGNRMFDAYTSTLGYGLRQTDGVVRRYTNDVFFAQIVKNKQKELGRLLSEKELETAAAQSQLRTNRLMGDQGRIEKPDMFRDATIDIVSQLQKSLHARANAYVYHFGEALSEGGLSGVTKVGRLTAALIMSTAAELMIDTGSSQIVLAALGASSEFDSRDIKAAREIMLKQGFMNLWGVGMFTGEGSLPTSVVENYNKRLESDGVLAALFDTLWPVVADHAATGTALALDMGINVGDQLVSNDAWNVAKALFGGKYMTREGMRFKVGMQQEKIDKRAMDGSINLPEDEFEEFRLDAVEGRTYTDMSSKEKLDKFNQTLKYRINKKYEMPMEAKLNPARAKSGLEKMKKDGVLERYISLIPAGSDEFVNLKKLYKNDDSFMKKVVDAIIGEQEKKWSAPLVPSRSENSTTGSPRTEKGDFKSVVSAIEKDLGRKLTKEEFQDVWDRVR